MWSIPRPDHGQQSEFVAGLRPSVARPAVLFPDDGGGTPKADSLGGAPRRDCQTWAATKQFRQIRCSLTPRGAGLIFLIERSHGFLPWLFF